ncbi:MAG: hypothetical protein WA160_13430 [Pseudobdellovibrio sp.]
MKILKVMPLTILTLSLWSIKTTDLPLLSKNKEVVTINKLISTEVLNTRNRNIASIPQAAAQNSKINHKFLTESEIQDLANYESIKNKVFLTDDEKQIRKGYFSNINLIKDLQNVLLYSKSIEIGSDLYNQKNIALDLLIEASIDTNSAEATAALFSIIEDKQIEDESLPLPDRQAMADIKAEILYSWTAKSTTNETEKISNLIPGPITAKIWTNVQNAQEQNRLESADTN